MSSPAKVAAAGTATDKTRSPTRIESKVRAPSATVTMSTPIQHATQDAPEDLRVPKITATAAPPGGQFVSTVGFLPQTPGGVTFIPQWPPGVTGVPISVSVPYTVKDGTNQTTVVPLVAGLGTTDSKMVESRMTLAQSYATAAEAKLSKEAEDQGLTPAELAEKKRKEGNMALLELAKVRIAFTISLVFLCVCSVLASLFQRSGPLQYCSMLNFTPCS